MYAFRKPFTVASYDGYAFLDIDLKIWLITAQVIGYTLSKFIGIRFISGLKPSKRAFSILILIGISEAGLLIFYKLPIPYNIIGMFINGLPLGIIWGIVFSYLEGRKLTELLGAGLSASFILSSGALKSIGRILINNYGVTEFAMPFVVGLIFAIPLVLSVFLLDSIPPPTIEDELARSRREPMNSKQRFDFLSRFFAGITILVLAYIILTFFREVRDNFAFEIWSKLGYSNSESIYTTAEIPVTVITLVSLALITFIKSNIKAFNTIQLFIVLSFSIILVATFLFSKELINGKSWMIIIGTGLYLGYVPFNAFLFERMISSFRCKGNIGFVMYICDSFGYLASLIIVFTKNFLSPDISWLELLMTSGIWLSFAGVILMIFSISYFKMKYTLLKL